MNSYVALLNVFKQSAVLCGFTSGSTYRFTLHRYTCLLAFFFFFGAPRAMLTLGYKLIFICNVVEVDKNTTLLALMENIY